MEYFSPSQKTTNNVWRDWLLVHQAESCLTSDIKPALLQRLMLSGKPAPKKPSIWLKESLVIRLRNEGYSYRSIRSQTGIALSTIRRVILEGALT